MCYPEIPKILRKVFYLILYLKFWFLCANANFDEEPITSHVLDPRGEGTQLHRHHCSESDDPDELAGQVDDPDAAAVVVKEPPAV